MPSIYINFFSARMYDDADASNNTALDAKSGMAVLDPLACIKPLLVPCENLEAPLSVNLRRHQSNDVIPITSVARSISGNSKQLFPSANVKSELEILFDTAAPIKSNSNFHNAISNVDYMTPQKLTTHVCIAPPNESIDRSIVISRKLYCLTGAFSSISSQQLVNIIL